MADQQKEAPRLRLGSTAPDFAAETTKGSFKSFHEWQGKNWAMLFSHPEDFTPVCTTELGAMARLQPEFEKRNVTAIGLSANTIDSHESWIKDIDDINDTSLSFPIIGDKDRQIAFLYDMLDYQDTTNVDSKGMALTIRSVFFIDPAHKIRARIEYPASTGRNASEILRVIDSLQLGDKHKIATPVNWKNGEDVIIHNSIKNDEAEKIFPGFRTVRPYLRYTEQPGAQP